MIIPREKGMLFSVCLSVRLTVCPGRFLHQISANAFAESGILLSLMRFEKKTATLDDLFLAAQSKLSGRGHFTILFTKVSVA